MAREFAFVMISRRFSSDLRVRLRASSTTARAAAPSGPSAGCPDRCRAPPRAAAAAAVGVGRPVDQPVLPVAEEREVVVGQPAQQLDRVGDVLVRHRQRRRSASSSASASARVRIFGQSSTASRTSVSTRCRSRRSWSRLVRRRRPGRSRCASSSRRGRRRSRRPAPPRRRPRSAGPAARGAPRAAGGPACCMSRWWPASSAVTESTRNGMSSVTISMTVWRRPSPGSLIRSTSWPGTRWAASSRCSQGGGEQLLGRAADQLLVGREPPVAVDQGGVDVVAGQGDGLGDQALGVGHRLGEVAVLGSSSVDAPATTQALRSERVDARSGVPIHGLPLPSTHHAVGSFLAQPRTSAVDGPTARRRQATGVRNPTAASISGLPGPGRHTRGVHVGQWRVGSRRGYGCVVRVRSNRVAIARGGRCAAGCRGPRRLLRRRRAARPTLDGVPDRLARRQAGLGRRSSRPPASKVAAGDVRTQIAALSGELKGQPPALKVAGEPAEAGNIADFPSTSTGRCPAARTGRTRPPCGSARARATRAGG